MNSARLSLKDCQSGRYAVNILAGVVSEILTNPTAMVWFIITLMVSQNVAASVTPAKAGVHSRQGRGENTGFRLAPE